MWDAGILMAKYAEYHTTKLVKSGDAKQMNKILDLGTGSGIGGLGWALCGHDVTLSDKAVISARTQNNVDLNLENVLKAGGQCKYSVYDWDKIHEYKTKLFDECAYRYCDAIIASDVVWSTVFITPYLKSLWEISRFVQQKQGSFPRLIMAHKTRAQDVDDELFRRLPEFGLRLKSKVMSGDISAEFAHPKIAVYEFEMMAKAKSLD